MHPEGGKREGQYRSVLLAGAVLAVLATGYGLLCRGPARGLPPHRRRSGNTLTGSPLATRLSFTSTLAAIRAILLQEPARHSPITLVISFDYQRHIAYSMSVQGEGSPLA